jgi:TIR domain
MANGDITAEWAWISKEPGTAHDYGVVASSVGIDALSYIWRYVSGVPNSSVPPDSPGGAPWLTFGPFTDETRRFISVTVQDSWQGRDMAGRPIWPRRFFLLRYDEVAASGATCRSLWTALRGVNLPVDGHQSARLSIESQPTDEPVETIVRYGIERIAAIAALLLEGQHVALAHSRELPLDERLAVLDAVFALLPYGFRAAISASTHVDSTIQHQITLVFAEFALDQVLVSLFGSGPIPVPETDVGQDYLHNLKQAAGTLGIQAVIRELSVHYEPLQVREPQYASNILARLSFTPAMLRAMEQHASNLKEIATKAAAHEPVLFAATYPGMLGIGIRKSLYVHVYRDGVGDQLDARLARLAGRLGPQQRRNNAAANTVIPRGTRLEVQPFIANIRCRPPRRTITWRNKLREVSFEIECTDPSAAGTQSTGCVLISTSGLPIAQIPISVVIPGRADALLLQSRTSTARMSDQVFASYSHEDAELVKRFRMAYEALDIYLFVDSQDIPGGAVWKQYLEHQIDQSDLFALFWSHASAASPSVEDEWRYALSAATNHPPEIRFVRPMYWTKPCPEIPEQLSGIHFRYFDPRAFGLDFHGGSYAEKRKGGIIGKLSRMIGSRSGG